MTKKEIQSLTFTPLYNPIEDRICLVLNYEDPYNRADLMITRSFMLNLIPSAEEYLQRHFTLEEPLGATQEESSSYKTATDNVNLELLQSKQELLLEVNFSLDESKQNIHVRFSSVEIQAVAVLPPLIFQALISSLKRAIPCVAWGVGFDF